MAKIYISSTYQDLKDYRERVSSVIRKMGHIDVAMEYYVAEDKRPLDKCLEDVAECDIYIGIFAWRYGYIPPGHEKSITELEYRKARESGKYCLIFLLKEDASWPMNLVDRENFKKIEGLRKELSTDYLLGFRSFSSIDELGECAAEAIHKWEKEKGAFSVTLQKVQELDIEKYRNAILKRYKILDLDALTPPERADYMEFHLRSVFVEQDVRENPPPVELPKELIEKLIKDEKLKKEDLPEGITFEDIKKAKEAYLEKPALPVLDVITNPENRYIVILGDPGSGKSTLSRYLVLSLLTKEDEKLRKAFDNYLPLLIELRDYAAECAKNKCNTFIEYLDFQGKTKGYGLTKEAIDNYLKNGGKAIVIFDGLDEIFDPAQRENIEQQIIGFTTDYPKTCVIAASRIVGYRRRNLTNAGFSHYTLQDFQKPQRDAFIDKWYNIALINNPDEAHARKERIDRAIEESASIRQLAGNPLLLTIMAIINKHQELPRERWRLYEHASSVLISHWDWSKTKIKDVSRDDKEELLRRIAYEMQSAPKGLAGNYIHADTLQAEFEKYFIERYQRNPSDGKLAAQALIEQLRERNFVLCRYGANLYGFIHRTFLEYFCAWSIVWKFNVKRELDIENLKIIFNEHWDDESWHEVLRLTCGMIDEKFSEALIYNLMQTPAPDQLDIIHAKVKKFSEITHLKDIWYTDESEESSEEPEIYVTFWKAKRIDLAIKCLGELKNIELIRQTSSELLKETCELIDFGLQGSSSRIGDGLSRFVSQNLIRSAISIGNRWAGREQLIEWIPKFVNSSDKRKGFYDYESYLDYKNNYKNIGKFIGLTGSGNDDIKYLIDSLLKHNSANLRVIALIALVSGWHDNQDTLPLLKDRAVSDKDSGVRSEAINALLDGWHDHPDTFHVLKDRAVGDEDKDIRNGVIKALLEGWHDHPDTSRLLQDRALNDFSSLVCSTAVSLIGQGWWKGDPNILKILQKYPRSSAIPIILRGDLSNDPNDFSFLSDLVKSASNGIKIRKFAIQQIAKIWKNDVNAFEFLKDRAVHDAYPDIRKTAISLLGEQWKDDPIVINMLHEQASREPNLAVRDVIDKILVGEDK